jgi:hypothetical protein
MQTSISLQEGPRGLPEREKPEEPHAQTGLRSGKLCAQYARKRYFLPASDLRSTYQ